MNLKDLPLVTSFDAASALAVIVAEHLIFVRGQNGYYFGAWEQVRWHEMLRLADGFGTLFVDILGLAPSEIALKPFLSVAGEICHCGIAIAVKVPPPVGSTDALKPCATRYLLRTLAGMRDRTDDLFRLEECPDHLAAMVDRHAANALTKSANRRICMPMILEVGDERLRIQGRYASRPRPEIDNTEFPLIGRIDGISQRRRQCEIVTQGNASHVEVLHFDVSSVLPDLRQRYLTDRPIRFRLRREIDDRNNIVRVIQGIEEADAP